MLITIYDLRLGFRLRMSAAQGLPIFLVIFLTTPHNHRGSRPRRVHRLTKRGERRLKAEFDPVAACVRKRRAWVAAKQGFRFASINFPVRSFNRVPMAQERWHELNEFRLVVREHNGASRLIGPGFGAATRTVFNGSKPGF